jgi:acetyl-CoA synthetase
VHHELKASTPESIPKSAIPAAVASPVPAPAATETVSLKSEETQATVKETKVPVVAEAHLVDTYHPPQRMFASMCFRPYNLC